MDVGGRCGPLTPLYEIIRYVHFMYVCDLARVWHPPTSYDVHTLLFFRTTLRSIIEYELLASVIATALKHSTAVVMSASGKRSFNPDITYYLQVSKQVCKKKYISFSLYLSQSV